MVGRRLLASLSLVLVHLIFVNPQCFICSTPDACELFNGGPIAGINITITCQQDVTNHTEVLDEDILFDGENVTSSLNDTVSTVIHPTSTQDIAHPNNASSIFANTSIFGHIRYLNFSHNGVDTFSGYFDNLTVLDLSHNVISNISRSQFHSPQLAHLVLSNNNLSSLCNLSHEELQILDAGHNKIVNMCLGKLPKLRILNLGDNDISYIDNVTLQRVPKLEILNLSTNLIAQLNDHNFNLSSLLRLYLANNRIEFLSEKCFYGLSRLQLLDISDNKITTVFPSMFQYIPLVQLAISNNPELMTQDFGILLASERLKSVNASRTNQSRIPACLTRSVRYLSLSHNRITQIQCGDLDSYPLLNSLDLSFNDISFIEDDALGRLELLETIILSHNKLPFIPYTLPNNLKVLRIDHNHLSKIIPTDFTGLVKLRHLDLSESNILSVADGSFSQMYELVSLNLSSNPIDIVSRSTFAGPHKLKMLDLSGLNNVAKCNQDLCFPVPEPNELLELHIKGSPELGHRLMNDAAAMKTFKQLSVLNMENCNLTDVVNDIYNYFPRLRLLYLAGNGLNCSKMYDLYVWSDISEVSECKFVINEKVTTTILSMTSSTEQTVQPSTEEEAIPTVSTEISLELYIKNNTFRYTEETEVISNEIWISDDQLGEVDAFSAEAPSSHPGLFVMLLVPVTLVGAILMLNYSRLKRRVRTERRREMDIEISNISSELW